MPVIAVSLHDSVTVINVLVTYIALVYVNDLKLKIRYRIIFNYCFLGDELINSFDFCSQRVNHLMLLIMEILIVHLEVMDNLVLETLVPSHVIVVMS